MANIKKINDPFVIYILLVKYDSYGNLNEV